MLDWKSGSGIWNDHGPQIAAYSKAPSLKEVIGKRKIEYTANLRLGTKHIKTNGYEFKIYDKKETNEHWKEFLAAKTIANANYKGFDPEKEIYEIPDRIQIKIKKEVKSSKKGRKKSSKLKTKRTCKKKQHHKNYIPGQKKQEK